MSTSGVSVVRSRWGPSASRAKVPLLVTAYANDQNLNFWSERPVEYAKWLKMVWVEFGCPGHGKGPWDGLGAMGKSKVTLDIMHGKELTSTGKITSSMLVTQHLRSIFCNKDWDMDHADMKIQQVVVMYLNIIWLLVYIMLACTWSRTRIQLLWTKSHGARLYAHQPDHLDRRRIYCHIIIRDSES